MLLKYFPPISNCYKYAIFDNILYSSQCIITDHFGKEVNYPDLTIYNFNNTKPNFISCVVFNSLWALINKL